MSPSKHREPAPQKLPDSGKMLCFKGLSPNESPFKGMNLAKSFKELAENRAKMTPVTPFPKLSFQPESDGKHSFNPEVDTTIKKELNFSELGVEFEPQGQGMDVELLSVDSEEKSSKEPLIEGFQYNNESTSRKKKRLWTLEEDELLRVLVEKHGAKDWKKLSEQFQDRCGKQCRQRWHNHLRQGIKKGSWTSEEEWLLFLGVEAYGKRWSQICQFLDSRTENSLKNHWNCKMKPKKKLYSKTLEEILSDREQISSDERFSEVERHLLEAILQKEELQHQSGENASLQDGLESFRAFFNFMKEADPLDISKFRQNGEQEKAEGKILSLMRALELQQEVKVEEAGDMVSESEEEDSAPVSCELHRNTPFLQMGFTMPEKMDLENSARK